MDVNTALEGLAFTPAAATAGSVTLTVSVAGTQSANSSLDMAVNGTLDAEAARDDILAGVTALADAITPWYTVKMLTVLVIIRGLVLRVQC